MSEIKKIYTLCYIFDGDQVLLGKKLKGWGAGWWNGFGGKPNEGEIIESAAVREMEEESGLKVTNLDKRAVIQFRFDLNPGEVNEVHVFKAKHLSGEPVASEEMQPEWFAVDKLPWDQMWSSDRIWLKEFFAGKKLRGDFLFAGDRQTDGEHKVVLESKIEEVSTF